MKLLGLDVGSNSVGSAWVDTDKQLIEMGVSVFPAGVEESDTKRGAPKNQTRRGYRSQRRITSRRAEQKRKMRRFLLEKGWMPNNANEEKIWLEANNPWVLRAEGLARELTPYEFGRVLLHMAQRRGAYGFDVDEEQEDAGKIKDAISQTRKAMDECGARTFGELMARKFKERTRGVGKKNKKIRTAIRNRTKGSGEGTYEFCADREMIWEEFDKLWNKQKSFRGELAKRLTNECRRELDKPEGDATWRFKGIIFGQRKTYWDVGTMARCDLEPTDMKCPKADMHAQEFLVLETVNNIRITPRGEMKRPLTKEERKKVIAALERQKSATEATVRRALGIDKGEKKAEFTLSLEKDPKRGLNTNWFKREIIGAIGKGEWARIDEKKQQSINRAILKFDPQERNDVDRLTEGCQRWWGFNDEQTERFIEAWKGRPKIDDRVNYSRKAIKNLLPYMREGFAPNAARNLFAEDATNGASDAQRKRYSFGARAVNRRVRQYIDKHPDMLPPAPGDISNPVVRKAIHEVRRHIQAYMRKFGCKPDRVVVELAREARQSAIVRNKQLAKNRARENERKKIIREFNLERETKTQQKKAVDRVLLWREQKFRCAYCEDTISEAAAAKGEGVEIDHITPESRGGNSYLSNLVVCHTRCNRGKGNQTPMEWLAKEKFELLERRLKHLEKENKVKWDNLHKEVPDLDGFVASQLIDTAYASRQVVGWLEKTLYGDRNDGRRYVFTTKGQYTSILRRDWGLFPDNKDGQHEDEKNRADHRHHAIDAVVIALSGPEKLRELAKAAERFELAKATGKAPPKREALSPPWKKFDSFRMDVMKQWENLVVAHRPEKRKIAGSLHNDRQFGPILDTNGKLTKYCTIRKFAVELTPKHLRVPEGWEELREKLEKSTSKAEQRTIRRQMLALEDVRPGKSGVVRDRWFREELRDCLKKNGLDPDKFTKKEIREFIKEKGFTTRSGVPVRHIILMRAPKVIEIKRKRWNLNTNTMEYETDKRTVRLYEPQNNHHIEIRENKKGKWVGEVITNFKAAQRVRREELSAVNRNDTEKGRFVMSLCIGEVVKMRHPDETKEAGYFTVFKLDGDSKTIHFTPHTDANPASSKEKDVKLREDIRLSAGQLQKLGMEEGKHPEKVWVGPLGDVKVLYRD